MVHCVIPRDATHTVVYSQWPPVILSGQMPPQKKPRGMGWGIHGTLSSRFSLHQPPSWHALLHLLNLPPHLARAGSQVVSVDISLQKSFTMDRHLHYGSMIRDSLRKYLILIHHGEEGMRRGLGVRLIILVFINHGLITKGEKKKVFGLKKITFQKFFCRP